MNSRGNDSSKTFIKNYKLYLHLKMID